MMDSNIDSVTPQPLNNTSPTNRLPLRRNGQQQACEPCRKAKVKCDHRVPICLKCERRKKNCVYLDAPMSRPKRLRSSERSSVSIAPISPLLNSRPSVPETKTFQSPVPASRLQRPGTSTRIGAPDQASGFLSSTSFADIVKENFVETLGPSESTLEIADMSKQLDKSNPMTSEQVQGITILRQLPNRRTCEALVRQINEMDECCCHQGTAAHITLSLWSTFGQYLEEPRHLQGLELVAQEIIHNSNKPLQEPDDYDEWLAAFSGPNMRWEALGIVFAAMAYSCIGWSATADTGSIQQGVRKPTKSFAIELKGHSESIIEILRKKETLNPLVVILLYKNLHLGTLIHGDSSFSVWRQHSDLIGAVTAINLHQDDGTNNSSSPEAVSISQQSRRRLFTAVFISDKCLALFNGRPPILSQRYCSCPLALDIPDEVYTRGKESLLLEVRDLDTNGWSRKHSGEIHTITFLRVRWLFCTILEEILEMNLGNREQFSEERLNNLKLRTDQIYTSLPPTLHFLRCNTHPISNLTSPISNQLHWTRLCCRLEYLRMTFLLERLSTERSSLPQSRSRQKLLDISRDMLDNTIYLWLQRDRFHQNLHDYDNMLMCFGMPSAGILCVELLRSIKQTGEEEDEVCVKLPRSEVVQNLSLLIGFLDWIKPSAGNYKLCLRMRQIIQRILDMVLDPNPSEPSEKRRKAEQQLRYLQPDMSEERERRYLDNGNETEARKEQGNGVQGQGEKQPSTGDRLSSSGYPVYSGATAFPSQYQIQTNGEQGIGSLEGFGAGVGNGMMNLNDAFSMDAGLENLDWLDTVDWTRGPWIDLNWADES